MLQSVSRSGRGWRGPTQRNGQDAIDILVGIMSFLPTGERLTRDLVGQAIRGRGLLEDEAGLAQEGVAARGHRRHIEELVVNLGEERSILLAEQPETRGGRAMCVRARL